MKNGCVSAEVADWGGGTCTEGPNPLKSVSIKTMSPLRPTATNPLENLGEHRKAPPQARDQKITLASPFGLGPKNYSPTALGTKPPVQGKLSDQTKRSNPRFSGLMVLVDIESHFHFD